MADPIMLLETENPGWKLEFSQLRAKEKLGRLFEYEVNALSPLPDIELKDMLGTKMSVVLTCHDQTKRYFTGYAVRAGQTGVRGRMHQYTIILRPWLWFATKQRNTRIFQDLKVDDILAKVFDHGIYQKRIHESENLNLTRSHEVRSNCVQFRESDFDFASRLMEEEGVYYWFDTDGSQVVFNLADNTSAHKPSPGTASLPYREHSGVSLSQEYVWEWHPYVHVPTQVAVLRDHNWLKPPAEKLEVIEVAPSTGLKDLELLEFYDYPDEYWDKDAPDNGPLRAQVITDREYAKWQRFAGKTNARNLRVGSLLQITDHPRKDQNGKYLIVEAEYDLDFSGNESQGQETWLPTHYECRFTAIKDNITYASERTTPKPVAPGPQFAVVVGENNNIEPEGDDIYTDTYGRVKVLFKWDRRDGEEGDGKEGKGFGKDSSIWIRVSQPWAGNHYGAMFIPRIGNEVIVEFVGGNLDRPIITGRVYNPAQMPPDAMALPANKTKTWIRTRSSPGGNDQNYNELVFEDKKGHELVGIHAERNMSTVVEVDDSTSVGHDQSLSVGHDRTVHIKHDQSTTIDNDRSIRVKNNDEEKVHHKQTINVGDDQKLTVGKTQTINVVGDQTDTFGANQNTTIVKHQKIIVGDGQETHVTAGQKTLVKGERLVNVTGDQTTSVTGNMSLSAVKNVDIKALVDRRDITASSHTVLANSLGLIAATGLKLTTTGSLDSVSVGSNTTVLGANTSGYIGDDSAATIGKASDTFLGMKTGNTLGMEISNTLGLQIENAITAKVANSLLVSEFVAAKFEFHALASFLPPVASGAAMEVLNAAAAPVILGVAAAGLVVGMAIGIGEGIGDIGALMEQYAEAIQQLEEARQAAADAGLDGLAERLGAMESIAAGRMAEAQAAAMAAVISPPGLIATTVAATLGGPASTAEAMGDAASDAAESGTNLAKGDSSPSAPPVAPPGTPTAPPGPDLS